MDQTLKSADTCKSSARQPAATKPKCAETANANVCRGVGCIYELRDGICA